MSTDIAEKQSQDLAAAESIVGQIDDSDLQLPVIQITHHSSSAVTDGKVPSGHFFNTVSGRDYGEELEFIIVAYQKGRFYVHNRDKADEKSFVANGPVAPDTWPEPYAGQAFADIPDAEEQWKSRVNAGEIEWGKGPPIVTTHNFVGLVADDLDVPARLGLSRTSAPAAKKILSVIRWSRKAPYNSVFKLELEERRVRDKPFFVATAAQSRQSSDDEVASAQGLWSAVNQAGAFALTGEEAGDDDAKPSAKSAKTPAGGVDV